MYQSAEKEYVELTFGERFCAQIVQKHRFVKKLSFKGRHEQDAHGPKELDLTWTFFRSLTLLVKSKHFFPHV